LDYAYVCYFYWVWGIRFWNLRKCLLVITLPGRGYPQPLGFGSHQPPNQASVRRIWRLPDIESWTFASDLEKWPEAMAFSRQGLCQIHLVKSKVMNRRIIVKSSQNNMSLYFSIFWT
jgi:hypothetical protein